jgi:hypothetical protein
MYHIRFTIRRTLAIMMLVTIAIAANAQILDYHQCHPLWPSQQ